MDNEKQDSALWFVIGFFIGGLVGAFLSLLFAPQPGRRTRKQIVRASGDAKGQTIRAAHQAKEAVDDFVNQSIEYINETLGK